jgi:hypothetical protein
MSKGFIDRVKANQAITAASLPIVTVKVSIMNDNTVQVERPKGDNPVQLAAIINLLAAAQQIICQKIAQAEPSRIVTVPPGTKVS